MRQKISTLISSRDFLASALASAELTDLGIGKPIGAPNANFLVVPILNRSSRKPDNVRTEKVYKELAEKCGVVVRFRGREPGCEGCVRVTVGSERENREFVEKLSEVLRKIE